MVLPIQCLPSNPQVIKPDNKVLPGHALKHHQLSANAGEAIAARAIKCAQKPTIRFDYDYKSVPSLYITKQSSQNI